MDKHCTKCGETKDITMFHANISTKDGRHGWCSICSNKTRRERPKKHYPRSEDNKKCGICKIVMSAENFWSDRIKTDGLAGDCKDCGRDRLYKKRFGITLEQYTSMLNEQWMMCAMCGKNEEENNQRLCVDHDHETGQVRGLLCNTCNTGLGLLQDNITILRNGVTYLNNHRKG